MEQGGATRPGLSMAFKEDLSVFFNPDEFADTFTHVETGGTFNGTFDANYTVEDMSEQVDFVVLAAAADVAAVRTRHTLAKGAERYLVLTVRPDGTGLAHILLQRGK